MTRSGTLTSQGGVGRVMMVRVMDGSRRKATDANGWDRKRWQNRKKMNKQNSQLRKTVVKMADRI